MIKKIKTKNQFSTFSYFLCILLTSCLQGEKHQHCNQNSTVFYQIDTISSLHRFIGYAERTYKLHKVNSNIINIGKCNSNRLIEVSWFVNDSLCGRSELKYKANIHNSLYFFADRDYQIEINPHNLKPTLKGLSDKNSTLIKFQFALQNIYTRLNKLEQWGESIRDTPNPTEDTKKWLLSETVNKRKAINESIDSLMVYLAIDNEPELSLILFANLLTIRPHQTINAFDNFTTSNTKRNKYFEDELQLYIDFYKKQSPIVPNFVAKDIDNKTFNLSDLRGKYVLLDFWASWCGPCIRTSSRTLKPLYKKFSSKGFEIVGISNEKNASDWRQSVIINDMPGIQIHCNSFFSPVSFLFNIKQLPTLLLLDKNGAVIQEVSEEELTNFLNANLI